MGRRVRRRGRGRWRRSVSLHRQSVSSGRRGSTHRLHRHCSKDINGGRGRPFSKSGSRGCSDLPTWSLPRSMLQFRALVFLVLWRHGADRFGGRGWPVGGVHSVAFGQHLPKRLETGLGILHSVAILCKRRRWAAGRRRRRIVVCHVYTLAQPAH